MIDHAKAVNTKIKPGGLIAIKREITPAITLTTLPARSSFFSSVFFFNPFCQKSLTIALLTIIRTAANVDIPAATTAARKIAAPKGERTAFVKVGIARSGFFSAGNNILETAPLR